MSDLHEQAGTKRARRAERTFCKRGHELVGRNLFITTKGRRVCRECRRMVSRAHDAGIPIETLPEDPELAAKRFWSFVDRSGGFDACWPWLCAPRRYGYGYYYVPGEVRAVYAHRFAWILVNGPVPDGLLIRHRCDNPPCCNPAHLEPGTHADNARDKWRTKTHCKRGHPLSGDNIRIKGKASRICLACQRLRNEAKRLGMSLTEYEARAALAGSAASHKETAK